MDKTDPKMAIVVLPKQTGFNQDSVMLQIFFKQNKQLTGKNQDSVPPVFTQERDIMERILYMKHSSKLIAWFP